MHKKGDLPGDPGVNMAVLITLIAVFVVAYVVLIPPSEREGLLGEEFAEEGESTTIQAEGMVLLEEEPGEIGPKDEETVTHSMSMVDLYIRSEPEVTSLLPTMHIKRNIFNDQYRVLILDLDSLENLEDVALYFLPRDPKGRLIIELNNNLIFDGELQDADLQIIQLPKSYLMEENRLKFSTSFSLLKSSSYILEDIKVRKEYKVENIMETRTFVIPEQDIDHIERSKLRYFIYCNNPVKGTTLLKIALNNDIIESTYIPCIGRYIETDIDEDLLEEGTNSLSFEIDKGDFRFSDIEFKTELDSVTYRKAYDFTISKEHRQDVKRNRLDAMLYMEFGDDEDPKKAELSVNDHYFTLSTERDTYSKEISSYIREGNNRFRIKPVDDLEILLLEIRLE